MLKISNRQMRSFEKRSMDTFIKKNILLLKEKAIVFTTDKTDGELETFISKVIQFSKSHNITKEFSIQRIMLLKIEHGFSYQLPSNLESILSGANFGEGYRISKFEEALTSVNIRTPITLETKLKKRMY